MESGVLLDPGSGSSRIRDGQPWMRIQLPGFLRDAPRIIAVEQ